MMEREEIRAAVFAALVETAPEVDPATADPAVDLYEEFELDSMDQLNLMTAIAAKTTIDVPERDYPEVRTIDRLVSYVARKLGLPA